MSDEVKNLDAVNNEPESAEDNKQLSDIEEIKEFNKDVLGKLDSPLVVHKKDDASYKENTEAFEMNETHTDEERPTLTRHRFKKEKKSKAGLVIILFFVFILGGIAAALYITGILPVGGNNVSEPVVTEAVTKEPTTSIEEAYAGTIVIKDTYIFVDGKEVNGIEGLQNALAYTTPSPTAYEIIDEHANSDFLNGDVLLILQDLGFFGETTKFTHVEKTGLISAEEQAIAANEAVSSEQQTEQPIELTSEQAF